MAAGRLCSGSGALLALFRCCTRQVHAPSCLSSTVLLLTVSPQYRQHCKGLVLRYLLSVMVNFAGSVDRIQGLLGPCGHLVEWAASEAPFSPGGQRLLAVDLPGPLLQEEQSKTPLRQLLWRFLPPTLLGQDQVKVWLSRQLQDVAVAATK